MKEFLAIVIMCIAIIGMVWFDHRSYGNAYEQGRKDKHAEIMESVTGDKHARIALVTKKGITYHEAGVCATCHSS